MPVLHDLHKHTDFLPDETKIPETKRVEFFAFFDKNERSFFFFDCLFLGKTRKKRGFFSETV